MSSSRPLQTEEAVHRAVGWLLATRPGELWPRWLFLRALGLVFLSAFYSLAFQIQGLIGPDGILPAATHLERLGRALPGAAHLWAAPTLLWLGAGHGALTTLVAVGAAASVALVLNLWPRGSTFVAFVAFLSFIAAAQDFASYQSDGMLLEASFLSLFYAPPGLRPGLGAGHPPIRAARFLLLWEWFRIYFESGVVKLASGDASWRDLTAMDHYYENGPLPTWVGWYVQHWPHAFHAATSLVTLVVELGLVWTMFLPRRFRLACFVTVTTLQISIIVTANYAFLNYLVLALGFLLLDDEAFSSATRTLGLCRAAQETGPDADVHARRPPSEPVAVSFWNALALVPLFWVFFATGADFILASAPAPLSWLLWPAQVLEPFRIANRYGLFAVMTPARYEIEFQGSNDGVTWTAYPFRYKPQALASPPGIYAPYQPRFEWNLWFASLGSCRNDRWVLQTESRLLENEPSVLALFASNPFGGTPPTEVRAVASQYWFTDLATKARTGRWWRRDPIGNYCPTLERRPDGTVKLAGG